MKTSTPFSAKAKTLFIFLFSFPLLSIAQWSAPVDLSPNAGNATLNESMGSNIANSGDTLHVMWTDKPFANKKISAIHYIRSFDDGVTWSNDVMITNPNGYALHAAVAVNGLNIHVAWMEIDTNDNTKRTAWYKHSTDGGNTWAPRILLDSVADWPAICVKGNDVFIVNDYHLTAANSEIFFLHSTDNGQTWPQRVQITNANGRSEDEALTVQGNYLHMAWNDNRNGTMQLFYKNSPDLGVTWGPDVVIVPAASPSSVYGPDVCVSGSDVGGVCNRTPNSYHPQIYIAQSADNGTTWNPGVNITNDTMNSYIYPTVVRDNCDIHVTYIKLGTGAQYLHSHDGGSTWDPPFTFFPGNVGITAFSLFTGTTLHLLCVDNATHHVMYLRNPTGNPGGCPPPMGMPATGETISLKLFPNPANDRITVQSPNELGLIIICNELGEIVYFQKSSAVSQEIDISQFPAGIYTLSAQGKFMRLVKE